MESCIIGAWGHASETIEVRVWFTSGTLDRVSDDVASGTESRAVIAELIVNILASRAGLHTLAGVEYVRDNTCEAGIGKGASEAWQFACLANHCKIIRT